MMRRIRESAGRNFAKLNLLSWLIKRSPKKEAVAQAAAGLKKLWDAVESNSRTA
jgi:hypothetical protein